MWKHRISFKPALLSRTSPTRTLSNSTHFYQNRQVELYAAKETNRLTLRQLIFFGRSIDEEKLLKSANYVRTEIPVRLAHRLRDLQALPYVVVTQEGVTKVYELYCSAFEKSFRRYPPITNLEENETFCHFLSNILNEHSTVIPSLTLGLSLGSPFVPPDELDAFVRRMLVSRISRRVLAEHHIALSESFSGKSGTTSRPHVGIIQTGLNVRESIEKCADLLRHRSTDLEQQDHNLEGRPWPEVVVDGHLDTEFPYIPAHLEYIVFELLKNAIRATVTNHASEKSFPAIQATIAAGKDEVGIRISDRGGGIRALESQIQTPSDLFSFSHVRNAARMEGSRIGALRTISSSEQGMWATVGEQVNRWLQHDNGADNPEPEPVVSLHTSTGIGLPMSNVYATYFGGSLELIPLDGWGTDVYVRLPKLGTNLEGIEV
ncbi:alpha-ketoacid dehydrogenase kinase [Pluteus cervinus]|uniref:Alpha-ketoacid dehydrogenase kinase n=1 Tax=Pluteus cervinus TaxID=181527 RepID=A0ACD3BCJ1_9AGAR|nr:alpha-ketoacid dehydrogenase kinase [Pluteus cervinus]